MCLTIYTNKADIPANMKLINYNDKFFQTVLLSNDGIMPEIIKTIDKGTVNSETTFIGRDKSLGALNKEHLSTGTKTLLNIISNPDKCFDVVECGQNALELLSLIQDGNILWEYPVLHCLGTRPCNIKIDNKVFTDFKEFLHYIMDERENNNEKY